ncbi:MAG: hypothetical protein ACFFBI_04185 [Promethearchaeota archaeon]
MAIDKGKELYRSVASDSNVRKVIKYSGLYVIGSLAGAFTIFFYIVIKEGNLLDIMFISLVTLIPLIVIILYILPEFEPFQPYFIIYEKAIKLRKPYLRILPITRIIPKEKVTDIEMKKEIHRFHTTNNLYIYMESLKPFKISKRWVENYEEGKIYF